MPPKTPIKMMIELSPEMVEGLMRHAIINGHLRENPRSAWGKKSRREAIEFAINKKLSECLPTYDT